MTVNCPTAMVEEDQLKRKLDLKMNIIRRYQKELASYEREYKDQQERISRLEAESGSCPHEIKKQYEVLEECRAIIPTVSKHLETAKEDLSAFLASASNFIASWFKRGGEEAATPIENPVTPIEEKEKDEGKTAKYNSLMPRQDLLKAIPEEIRNRLRPDLSKPQLAAVLRMIRYRIPIPPHLRPPNLTAVPEDPKEAVWHLTRPLRRKGGRNHHGRITVRHRGGGLKKRIRLVDRNRQWENDQKVVRLETDPNRSANLALLQDCQTGKLSYVIAWTGAQPGALIKGTLSGKSTTAAPADDAQMVAAFGTGDQSAMDGGSSDLPRQLPGVTMRLKDITVGSIIHNIELRPGRGGQLVRSAGTKAVLVGKDTASLTGTAGTRRLYATIRMPSEKTIQVPLECHATIGAVGNADWHLRVIGKAGNSRKMGIRPSVRGVAMNPVDHPHGGGKGRSKGRPSQSPWGKICK